MVEEQEIKCPNCGSNQIKTEFGEVKVCSNCNHKFNVHLVQKNSPKIILIGILFIVGLIAIIQYAIPKFDEQKAMEELMQQQTQTSQKNESSKRKIITEKIEFVNNKKIWESKIDANSDLITISLQIMDAENKKVEDEIALAIIQVKEDNPYDLVTVPFEKSLFVIINQNKIIEINIASKEIVAENNTFITKYNELKNGIQKIEYSKAMQAILFQNLDGATFYYFPKTQLFVSNIELTQLRKMEQTGDNWKFEKKYIILNGKLFAITKKTQQYTMELSSSDIQTILEGADWMKKNYAIVAIDQILKNVDFSNTEILYSNETEIVCVNESKSEVVYYNLKTNKTWHRKIDDIQNKQLQTNISGSEVLIYHSNNAYVFDKKDGNLIWKY